MMFIIDKRVFCYKVISFGLKNVGITYQRMMNKGFKDQMGRNLKVYIDDMLITSRSLDNHFTDLEEKFIVMKNNKF